MLEMVTVIFAELGLAVTIPLMLMFSVMLPDATTCEKAMLVHDTFTPELTVGSVLLLVVQLGSTTSTAAAKERTTKR